MSLPTLESLAGRILREHAAATISADSAIEHARKAGTLLLEARERCERGKWESWLRENCSAISTTTAQAYMRVARAPLIEADSLREALGKLAKHREPNNPQRVAPRQATECETEVSKTTGAPPLGDPPRSEQLAAATAKATLPPRNDEPERPDESGDDAALEAAEQAWRARMDQVLAADDKLAEMSRQLKEVQGMYQYEKREHERYMNENSALIRQNKALQRKLDRLEKKAA